MGEFHVYIEVGATLLINLLIGGYVYGRLTERVHGHDQKHQEHDREFEDIHGEQARQWESIGRQGNDISNIQGRLNRGK